MTADDLADVAQQLARMDPGNPRQASLKRAISTAYYALFHAVCHECVNRTIGWSFKSPHYWQVVTPLYRSIEHGAARRMFERLSRDKAAPSSLRTVAEFFVELQLARISADYDPASRFSRKQSLDLVRQARDAIEALRGLPLDTRLLLAVQLVTKQR